MDSGGVSGGALPARDDLGRRLALLGRAVVYELQKATAFRAGFIVRELLRGLFHPLVMICVYRGILGGGGEELGGFSYRELVHYLLLVAVFDKLVFHRDGLELSTQIFEGYLTKYLVMPLDYFVLALARWVQFMLVELPLMALVWTAGALALPGWWPMPSSGAALAQALALIVLGSYCFFLTFFIVHTLAFWLDVVWTLIVMVTFVGTFMRGVLIPISAMPEALRAALEWCFPYWTLSAPIEIYLGRLSTGDFARGAGVLLASALLLELLRRELWRRGRRRYAGSGM